MELLKEYRFGERMATNNMRKLFRKIYCRIKYGASPFFIGNQEYWHLGNHLTGRCGCGRHLDN